MATALAYTAHYSHPVAAVREAFCNEQYWKDRIAAVGGPEAQFVSLNVEGEQVRVEVVQSIPADLLPPAITAVRPGDLIIPRTELWTGTTGSFEARVEGAPAEVRGTITATDEPTGAVAEISGTIEVKVPLFGRKIEEAIGERLTELLAEETEFTNTWIAEQG
ncbi:DUF2505 domain-containing protein [Nocardia jinanensis]|uniref:DUF2505 domain-containing protein n=1 Tax=Nocardia jinanensis TaxID=382504 RepID=A0A917RTL6_9NOCA|nr:DUF2505 domain-containing protein [Nocardia jinanensis]GGL29045.1 hypothetical protein GCM10011588_49870 [Nocardia jinanensis]